MLTLESDHHLFQPQSYTNGNGVWFEDFWSAVSEHHGRLHLDPSAILGIICYGYALGNRTVFKEIYRKPWLSALNSDGSVRIHPIPKHGRRIVRARQAASMLLDLLEAELVQICSGYKSIYVQLSGGLDSRIIAAIAVRAALNGKISSKPIAVTWGIKNSRDMFYASHVAGVLELDWHPLYMTPGVLLNNTDRCVEVLGCQVSPIHLHHMTWFESLTRNDLVIAATYGDSIGRGEFQGKHVLSLNPLVAFNRFELFEEDVYREAAEGMKDDLAKLHERIQAAPRHVVCEIERHAYYIRNLCALTMSAMLNRHCRVYQMFTDPSVYQTMWSIHPSFRQDAVYAELLELLNPELARIPWSRTNRTLRGKPSILDQSLTEHHSIYDDWIREDLRQPVIESLDDRVLAETGIFRIASINKIKEKAVKKTSELQIYSILIWLFAFQKFLIKTRADSGDDHVSESETAVPSIVSSTNPTSSIWSFNRMSAIKYALKDRCPVMLYDIWIWGRKLKKTILRIAALLRFFPCFFKIIR